MTEIGPQTSPAIYGLKPGWAIRALRTAGPYQNDGGPATKRNTLSQDQPARAITGDGGGGLRIKDPGQHHPTARCNERRDGRGKHLQRLEQDVGEHESKGRALAKAASANTGRMHGLNAGSDAIDARIFSRDCHRPPVDIAGEDRTAQRFRSGDGKNPGASANIKHCRARRPTARARCGVGYRAPTIFPRGQSLVSAVSFRDAVEGEQTSLGAAVMAGAEGERCLDLDAEFG